ncbi:RDD family protein [Sulfurimonas lithotrophica]|uniref:RDD family protein n=1 Tax=Sulfurimonas lithotrophica TaxID=2590022 RepID=A0A5P8P2R9_9BACT|nr:RDD family protein [Sulfurimonas lithotrophica]QFR49870.1 RDD family protein [Sulfurimonas lithotrophica]
MNEEIEDILYREEMSLASTSKRATAFLIDELLLSFVLVLALWDSFAAAKDTQEMIELTNTFLMEFLAIKIIYQAFFVMQYGASIGKLVMKIRVIEIKTLQNPNVLSALNRAIFRVVSELLFYLGYLWAIFDPARQAWHDKTAKTLVVNV